MMNRTGEESKRARSEQSAAGIKAAERSVHERECVHSRRGVESEVYPGQDYLTALQHLKGPAALTMGRNVESFFWSDVLKIKVWLCGECADTLRLRR